MEGSRTEWFIEDAVEQVVMLVKLLQSLPELRLRSSSFAAVESGNIVRVDSESDFPAL
jgi:hypothetical protein